MSVDFRLRVQRALADRYTLGRELGRGGMAIVFHAHDLRTDTPVAIKLLLPTVVSHLGVQRFVREVELAGRLQHPNILQVLEAGEADGLPFYSMPFIGGPTLRDRIVPDQGLPISEVVAIGAQVADALACAHDQDVLHRDIKPENLLLDGNRVVVTDFGIGKALTVSGASSLTETGFIVGTPAYMSPEQAAGDPLLDGRSDLYSLGVVLFEMVTGQLPFTGKSAQQLIASRFTTTPASLASKRADVPAGLDALVAGLLAIRAADRQASAHVVARLLRSTMDDPA